MTTDELKAALADAKEALETNKNLVTPELIETIQKYIDDYSKDELIKRAVMAALGMNETKLNNFINGFNKALATERRLINSDLTERLLNSIDNIEKRPFVLRTLAAFI